MKATLFVAAALAGCATLYAQTNEPPAVIQITRESVKEGRGAAHRRVEQDYANTFRKNKFPFHYIGLSSMSGPNEAWFLAAYPSFAGVEEADQLSQKAPLKSDLELADARDGELRAESRSLTMVLRKDLSYLPENRVPLGKVRYFMIDNYRMRLGQSEAFTAGAKMLLDGYRKANLKEEVLGYEVIAGAPNGVFLFLVPMESLKDMDAAMANRKALADAVGQDNLNRLTKGEGEVFQTMESTLFSVSPEMSYLPKEIEDADPAFWRPKVTVSRAAKPAEKTEKP